MRKLKYFLFITLLFSMTSLFAAEDPYEINSLKLHIRISELTTSEAPFIFGENIVFTYKPSRNMVRHVGVAFLNENFSKIHNLYKNENGVYFYLYKYPQIDEVNYRFIEDGVWLTDQNSDLSRVTNSHITLSSYKIPKNSIKELNSPIINGREVTFKIRQNKGDSVYLTGDFNNWNPFLYPLKNSGDGIFSITLNLPEGKYGYYFVSNGERKLDSENFNRGYSRLGEEVSILNIE